MLLVLENSTHDTSNDVVQLFGPRLHWLLDKVTPASPTIAVLSLAASILYMSFGRVVSQYVQIPKVQACEKPNFVLRSTRHTSTTHT